MQEDARRDAERLIGLRLMEALGTAEAVQLELQEERLPWINRAISVYQVLTPPRPPTLFPDQSCLHLCDSYDSSPLYVVS